MMELKSIGVDLFSRLGEDRCPMRGSEATERGEGVGGGYPPPTVRTFPPPKLEYQNSILGHLNDVLGN